jgi:DNA-directed RNA polymerase subunit N (RpoN/RPB10)
MSFFKNLFSPPRPTGTFHSFSVKCKRCGETIQGQVNVNNEPSLELDEKGKAYYTCRKVLIGNGICFQQVEVVFKFDEDRRILDRKISGGEFVED